MHVTLFQLMGNPFLKMWSFAITCVQLSVHRLLFQCDLHLLVFSTWSQNFTLITRSTVN